MSRVRRLVARLPLCDLTRRALGEVAADWHHESRGARRGPESGAGARLRLAAAWAALTATARIVLSAFGSFEEPPMRNLGRDVVFGWRRLKGSPAFTIFSILSLALGIGATTTIYAAVQAAIAPPSGVRDVDALVNISHAPVGSGPIIGFSLPDFEDLARRQTTLDGVVAFRHLGQTLSAGGSSRTGFGELVGGNYFQLLGVNAALGRTLQPQDDRPGAPLVVVLGHDVWQGMFGGRPDVIGQPVTLNGLVFEVVGVAPRDFRGLFNNGLVPSLGWVPLSTAPLFPALDATDRWADRDSRWLFVRGRLREGSSLVRVRSEVTAIATQLDAEHPIGLDITDPRFRSPYNISRPWTTRLTRDVPINEGAMRVAHPVVWALMSAVAIVLLVACSNLANLMVARGSVRRHELAVRLALGASRWRLLREGVVETLILAVAGGALGVGIARLLLVMLSRPVSIGNGGTVALAPRLDPAVVGAALFATLLALLVAGVVPAWVSSRADVRSALASDGSSAALPRWRGRRLLITAQVAVSVTLLAVAALFVSQVSAESRLDGGIDLDRFAVASVDFSTQQYDEVRTRHTVDRLLAEVSRRPGIEAVAVSSGLPFGSTTPGASVRGPDGNTMAQFVATTSDIFRTIGVSIVSGRAFDERDRAAGEPVVIVTESTARGLFARTDVVGQQIEVERRRWVGQAAQPARLRTIVGVVSDSDSGIAGRRDQGVVYLPFAQQFEGRLVVSARAVGDPGAIVGEVRGAIVAVDPDLGITEIGMARAIVGPSNLFGQVAAVVSTLLGAFGLILALAGLYGVLSHVVSRRSREIGLRLALGATPGGILRLVTREGLSPVLLGVVAGGVLAVIARLAMQPMFSRLLPTADWVALGLVPVLLLLAGALACYFPARRAARVDPNVALRQV